MIAVALSIVAVFVVLMLGEWLWRTHRLSGEFGRKFIHITVGTFVAFWPFYMSFSSIQLISLAFLLVVLSSRYLNIFKSVHTIERKSWGDALFAVGIGLAAFFTNSAWIFAAAILHLSLADGLAAVIGKHYGKSSEYTVLGYTKSVVGTTTFLITSVAILILALSHGGAGVSVVSPLLIWVPISAVILENFGIYGLDNIFVPLLIVGVLSQLQFVL